MKFNKLLKNKKKVFKLIFNIKEKNIGVVSKLKSKIFYNLTFNYIKNNFQLINKLINVKYLSLSKVLISNSYKFSDSKIYNDLFILDYINKFLNDPFKLTFFLNKNQKPLTFISILKKLIFSNSSFIRLIKTNKILIKNNVYTLFFVLFYYFNINNDSYNLFLKFNKKKNKSYFLNLKKNLFNNINIKTKFLFFFKNIIMFFYKFSLIKKNKKKMLNLFLNKPKKRLIKFKLTNILKKNKINKFKLLLKKKNIIKFKSKKKLLVLNKKKIKFYLNKKKLTKKDKNLIFFLVKTNKKLKKKKKKIYHKKKKKIKIKKNLFFLKKFKNRLKIKLLNKYKKIIKINNKYNNNKIKIFKMNNSYKLLIIKKILKLFKMSFNLKRKKRKKKCKFFYKKLFVKNFLVKRRFELSYKKDNQLKRYLNILKNNKKFKFLTFPINSICKFFFKTSMYNIFMTLMIFPLNLTIANYSGGQFNLLSKRRDRGSINSLKYMTKLIALKIYQSNLNFIFFCPQLSTFYNKRYIKTIFYSFKILNKSPITKIYLYRPVIRNGIRKKKIPRK